MMKPTRNQWINAILTTGAVILTPIVGIYGPFNNGNLEGSTTTELFLPAGYAFSIWPVIYIGLFAFGIWQGLAAQTNNRRAQNAAPWISATALANVIWILLAGSLETVPWTVVPMVVMGITAWVAYFKLEIGNPGLPAAEKRLHVPLQLYVGWLSVATIANSAAALNAIGWSGWGLDPVTWTLIMTVVAVVVAWVVGQQVNQDNIYRGVFVWAFVAIYVAQQAYPLVAWGALIAAAAILLMIVGTWQGLRRGRLATT